MGQVLGIVYRGIATHLIKKAGFSRKTAQAGAVTLIQRFGSALNLNIHFHMLFLHIETCRECGGAVRIIACIDDPVMIEKILTHLDEKGASAEASRRPRCRAPPQAGLFD